jgi:hypothetical protein
VQQLRELLRHKGSVVERNRKEVLDVLDITMKESCRDVNLDVVTRLHLLEILELRMNNWQVDPIIAALYRYIKTVKNANFSYFRYFLGLLYMILYLIKKTLSM